MANEKKVFSAVDASPEVLYAKVDASSELAYPIICDTDGSLNIHVVDATIEQVTGATHNDLNIAVAGKDGSSKVIPIPIRDAGDYAVGLPTSSTGVVTVAIPHQQWSTAHAHNVGADDKFYPQQMDDEGNLYADLAKIKNVAVDVNSGNKSNGTQRVILATDQPALTNPQPFDLKKINGNDPNLGNGAATTTGTLRVTVASDSTGNIGIVPRVSGGFSTYHLVSAGSTNATSIKASAGQVFGWFIYNAASAMRKLAFHNLATTPTAGTNVFFSIPIPAGSAANVFTETGIPFSNGIGITTVTEVADNGTTAISANELVINVFYL